MSSSAAYASAWTPRAGSPRGPEVRTELRIGWRMSRIGGGLQMDEHTRSRSSRSLRGRRLVVGSVLIGLGIIVGIIAALLG